MTKKILPADDEFVWIKGLISNPDTWTLQDPNRLNVAHVYPAFSQRGPRWEALTDAGQIIGSYDTSREAIAAVDNECRPYAYPLDGDRDHSSRR